MSAENNSLVNVVVIFIVRSIRQQNSKSGSEGEENLSSCVNPYLITEKHHSKNTSKINNSFHTKRKSYLWLCNSLKIRAQIVCDASGRTRERNSSHQKN